MKINIIKENNIEIAVVNSSDILITDVQSALDFIATVKNGHCRRFFCIYK